MTTILRAMRPVRKELKALLTGKPNLEIEFTTPEESGKFIKDTNLFIANLQTTKAAMDKLYDKLLVVECAKEADQKAIDEQAEADSTLLLEVGHCIDKYVNHIMSLEIEPNERNQPPQQTVQRQREPPPPAQMVNLPKLEIKKFAGSITQWQEFWDSYDTAVHNNTTLSQVTKFTYLRSLLMGEALSAISGLSMTADNYDQAIEILRARYGDQQLVINSHYVALSNLQQASDGTLAIRNTIDKMEKHLRSLEALGEDVTHKHFISLIFSKLPRHFIMRLEEHRGEEAWTVSILRNKIQQLLRAREVAEQHQNPATTTPKPEQQKKMYNMHTTTSAMMMGAEERKTGGKCIFCNGKHWSDECRNYPTVETRKQQLNGRCFVCLQKGHTHKQCNSERPCVHCSQMKNHHRSLCPRRFSQQRGGREEATWKQKVKENSFTKNTKLKSENAYSLGESQKKERTVEASGENAFINTDARGVLQTARAWVTPQSANPRAGVNVRMVLDCASQRTYVTNELIRKLNVKPYAKETLLVYPFGVTEPKRIETDVVRLEMSLLDGSKFGLMAHTVPKIGDIHHPPIPISQFSPLIKTLPLADPNQNAENRTIDLLVGINYYWDLVTAEKIELSKGLYLIGTKLGWTVCGRTNESEGWKHKPSAVMMTQVSTLPIENEPFVEADAPLLQETKLQDWWNLETIGIHDCPYDSSDEMAMIKFNETIRYEEGRYFVAWPWKKNVENLPTNYALAMGRMKSLLRRLENDTDLLQKYDDIIRTQEARGIIEKVPVNEDESTRKHYLPHHPVITPDKDTTKVRIVYDGSAKNKKENPSINECMHRGPVILDDVCSLLIRFRFYQCALIADIEKAFLQVGLLPDERDVTRFIWMKDPGKLTLQDNMQIYRFARVPFGIISSPFLLGATIQHHLSKVNGPTAPSTKEAIQFYHDGKALFQSASMNLREWLSNDQEVMSTIPEEDRVKKTSTKVLGLKWDTKTDTLVLVNTVDQPEEKSVINKRHVLKSIAKVFDPLGLWSPAMVPAKSFLQNLWAENNDWDRPIGEQKSMEWEEIVKNIYPINSITIPRRIGMNHNGGPITYELHIFTDSSKKAYGACAYMRTTQGPHVSVDLLFAKSRVTPTREITLPRLELLATTVGGRLLQFVEKSVNVPISSRYIWTDSQCVLNWIQSTKPLSVFVSNRVKELRSINNVEFRYVPTEQNPADLASRGTKANELRENNLWWNGPTWLREKATEWPRVVDRFCIDADTLQKISSEEKKSIVFETSLLMGNKETPSPFGIDYSRFSNLTKLLRITAWGNQLYQKLKIKSMKEKQINPHGPALNANEIETAKMMWIKYIQKCNFSGVIEAIKTGKRVPFGEQLGLWMDENGIVRCKGRLINANLEHDATFPILLPKKNWFTTLVIQSYHANLYHSGIAHTLSQIRHEFWIRSGRSEVLRVLRSCGICKRFEGGPYRPPKMPALPKERVSESPPFTRTGLDYLGPLYVKTGGQEEKKVWISLFTCMVTRAVHLELVENLTAEHFLMALRRFIARRGKPDFIISDNAKQFKLTKSAIDQLWKEVKQHEAIMT